MSKNIMRWDVINKVLQSYQYPSYCEIGVRRYECFNKISAARKVSVDPAAIGRRADYAMTSDDFFATYTSAQLHLKSPFDVIFVDGLHEEGQVWRDICNSERILAARGTIICHDCLPETEWDQRPLPEDFAGERWYGTAWRAVARLRRERCDMDVRTVDADCGCAIIRRRQIPPNTLTWADYEAGRDDIMGVIGFDEI